ncbi:MAG: galactose mutarotase [Chitinophagaceae bacterium]|nr:galactose mutarotase [Chitinophagaceae bacterium]
MSASFSILPFAEMDGKTVHRFIVTHPSGLQIHAINYGATLTGIFTPDKSGKPGNIVLGFTNLEDYFRFGGHYIGGICGRFANRIAGSRFRINGTEYRLNQNGTSYCLHGGAIGFDKKFWEADILPDKSGLVFFYTSPDGEEGFPGNLKVKVTYQLFDRELHIGFYARTDQPTYVNLTNHSYFNLSAGTERDIYMHEIMIPAESIVEVNEQLIPTGEIRDIRNTELDFRSFRSLAPALGAPRNIDYSWVINCKRKSSPVHAATLRHKPSGRVLDVFTTQPAIHVYNGYMLSSGQTALSSASALHPFGGICLETQHFPDSPNHPHFPETLLTPDKEYHEKTIFRFSLN